MLISLVVAITSHCVHKHAIMLYTETYKFTSQLHVRKVGAGRTSQCCWSSPGHIESLLGKNQFGGGQKLRWKNKGKGISWGLSERILNAVPTLYGVLSTAPSHLKDSMQARVGGER